MLTHHSSPYAQAWDEGVFEMIDNALKAWPDDCEGAYFCCLSNPQNLDITEVLNHPDGSPFERILSCGVVTDFVMLANSNTPIHSRLWCVLEAFKAWLERIRNVGISGEPVHLLTGANRDALRVEEQAAQAQRACEETAMKDELEERLKYPELLGAGSRPVGSEHQYQAFQDAARRVAEAKLVVLEMPDAELIDLDCARCVSAEDERMIRAAMSGHEPAICQLVVGLLRDAFCGVSQVPADAEIAPGGLALSLVDSTIDLRERLSLSSDPLLLLQFVGWMRLRPKVETLYLSAMTARAHALLKSSISEGLLPKLAELTIADTADEVVSEMLTLAADSQAVQTSQPPPLLPPPLQPPPRRATSTPAVRHPALFRNQGSGSRWQSLVTETPLNQHGCDPPMLKRGGSRSRFPALSGSGKLLPLSLSPSRRVRQTGEAASDSMMANDSAQQNEMELVGVQP